MSYQEIKFKLTIAQAKKLTLGMKQNSAVTLRLTNSSTCANGIPLLFTKPQVAKLNDGKTHDITFSTAQLNKLSKHGGFLPALLAAIPTIAALLGGIGSVTGIAKNIKDMATGTGVVSDLVAHIPVLGNVLSPVLKSLGLGLEKKKKKRQGKGLFLRSQPA